MDILGKLNSITKTASSLRSESDEVSTARDEILQGSDPEDVASSLGVHPSDLAEKFEQRGEEELQRAEEGETKIRNGVEATEKRLDQIVKVESHDLAKCKSHLETADKRLKAAEEGEEEIGEATKDAEKYFRASLKIAKTSETQVGQKRPREKIQEAEEFEEKVRDDLESSEEFRQLVDRCWEKIDSVRNETGDSGIERQEEAVESVAKTIHNEMS